MNLTECSQISVQEIFFISEISKMWQGLFTAKYQYKEMAIIVGCKQCGAKTVTEILLGNTFILRFCKIVCFIRNFGQKKTVCSKEVVDESPFFYARQ